MTGDQVYKIGSMVESIFGKEANYVIIVSAKEIEVATNVRQEKAIRILEDGLYICEQNKPEKAVRLS